MKLSIIGSTGHVNYVLNSLDKLPDLQVAGIAPGSTGEPMEKVVRNLAKYDCQPAVYESAQELFDREKPDIAVIASYMGDNGDLAAEALNRGMHVFVEKPAATTLSGLEQLREAHARSGAELAAMLGGRYDRAFLTAWEAVRQGAVGQVRNVHAQKSYKLGTRGVPFTSRSTYGGTIPWVGSHAIDWLIWFGGERFQSVYASHSALFNRGHGELEMSASCLFTLSGEGTATASIDYLRPQQAPSHGDDRVRVAGTEGVVEVREGRALLINGDGPQELPLAPARPFFAEFVQQIRGEGKCLVSAEDSFYTTEMCLRAQESADEKRLIVL